MPISQKQIEEWCDAEVTQYFLKLVQTKLDTTFKERGEVFFAFEPMKTQEAKSHLLGAEGALQDLIDVIVEKDFTQLEEQVDEERVGNTSVPGSSADKAG